MKFWDCLFKFFGDLIQGEIAGVKNLRHCSVSMLREFAALRNFVQFSLPRLWLLFVAIVALSLHSLQHNAEKKHFSNNCDKMLLHFLHQSTFVFLFARHRGE